MKKYAINEIFGPTIQGEGVRSGTVNIFIRFQGCNLRCTDGDEHGPENNQGWFCDTEWTSGKLYTLEDLEREILRCNLKDDFDPKDGLGELRSKNRSDCYWLVLTGGEPALQIDREFCDYFHGLGYKLAIETNGTIELPRLSDIEISKCHSKGHFVENEEEYCLDWICVSPKSADHTIKQKYAHEFKLVRNLTQQLPATPCVEAIHYLVSPAFAPVMLDGKHVPDPSVMRHCLELVLKNPRWRLSIQNHKLLNVR